MHDPTEHLQHYNTHLYFILYKASCMIEDYPNETISFLILVKIPMSPKMPNMINVETGRYRCIEQCMWYSQKVTLKLIYGLKSAKLLL